MGRTIIASVVTSALLKEFTVLYRSFGMFNDQAVQWIVRTDRATASLLPALSNAHISIMQQSLGEPDAGIGSLGHARQILSCIGTGTASGADTIVYLSPDVIVLRPFLDSFPDGISFSGKVRMLGATQLGPLPSPFQSAALVLRSGKSFHEWWSAAMAREAGPEISAQALENFHHEFRPTLLDNYLECRPFEMISENSTFVDVGKQSYSFARVPLFERSGSVSDLVQRTFLLDFAMYNGNARYKPYFTLEELPRKAFAIQLVRYLKKSACPEHRQLSAEIGTMDGLGLYRTITTSREQVPV